MHTTIKQSGDEEYWSLAKESNIVNTWKVGFNFGNNDALNSIRTRNGVKRLDKAEEAMETLNYFNLYVKKTKLLSTR